MPFIRRFRDATICVALLALPFFFLNANLKDPSTINSLDRVLLQVSAPIQYVTTQFTLGLSSIWEDYLYLVDVHSENRRLEAHNARLRETNHQLRGQAIENRRLRRLLQLRDQLPGHLISTQVIGKEVSPHFRVMRLRLDRGERDQIQEGMPVLTPDGLVGQIRRTWGRYSDVLLTADKTSSIDAVVQRTGARGMLKGTGGNSHYICRLENLLRADDAKIGDVVVTSGLGRRFPGSIVIGRISKVLKRDHGLYQEVEVEPAVDFSRLEEALILTAGSRGQLSDEPPDPHRKLLSEE